MAEFGAERDFASVRLYYRRVNHAERWQSAPMQAAGRAWRGSIPAEYTQSPYALQYYFEVKETAGPPKPSSGESGPQSAALYPGLGGQRTNQPYFLVRRQP